MKYTVPVAAPRLATASTIRNSDMDVKKAPAAALLKVLAMITVSATVPRPATAAPTRLRRLPLAASASGPSVWPSVRPSSCKRPAGAAARGLVGCITAVARRCAGGDAGRQGVFVAQDLLTVTRLGTLARPGVPPELRARSWWRSH